MTWRNGKGCSLAAAMVAILFVSGGRSDAQSSFVPGGGCAPGVSTGCRIAGNAVFAAYQKAYAMNFEVWRPEGMPGGWYATFDGFPVAQIAPNRWVYGRTGGDGCLVPTCVLVGSVVPANVPELARVAATWVCNDFIRSREFRMILEYGCDHMGILEDPLVRTVIAWRSGRPGVWVWLADRWGRVSPSGGQHTWEALGKKRPWIAERLRERDCFWVCGDAWDLADLARTWGLVWHGDVPMRFLSSYRQDEGGRGGRGGGFHPAPTPPPSDNPGGQWDVGDGSDRTSPGGGGGWDTGGK